MRVAVDSRVIFEVPDGSRIDLVEERFRAAQEWAIGRPMETLKGTRGEPGQQYVMLALEHLDVTPA